MGLQADKGSVVVSKRRSGRGAERLVEKISAATPRATRDRSAARGPTARRRGPSHTCPLQKFLQRLLREPPGMELRHCIAENVPTVAPDIDDRAVFEEFASYDMLSIAVVDEAGPGGRPLVVAE